MGKQKKSGKKKLTALEIILLTTAILNLIEVIMEIIIILIE